MADAMEENGTEDLETLRERHKKENKDLLAKIQALKHSVPKGDKKRKKTVAVDIAKLEAEHEERHKKEIAELKAETANSNAESDISPRLQDTSITEREEASRPSRAEKRRAKKAAKEQEREKRIAEAELENVNCARNVEAEQMKSILKERNLQIFEITPDGHCLYNATADQLRRRKLESDYQHLRKQVSEYMLTHSSDFLPFLVHQQTGDCFTSDEFNKYCQDIVSTSAWGGQLELQALSHILKMPIEVIQASAPVVKIGEEFNASPILLSYHHHAYGLGEHYNSLIPVTSDDEH